MGIHTYKPHQAIASGVIVKSFRSKLEVFVLFKRDIVWGVPFRMLVTSEELQQQINFLMEPKVL